MKELKTLRNEVANFTNSANLMTAFANARNAEVLTSEITDKVHDFNLFGSGKDKLLALIDAELDNSESDIPEKEYDKEKGMTLETTTSKLTRRLQEVNPDVTLETTKKVLELDDENKEKVFRAYRGQMNASWEYDVRKWLGLPKTHDKPAEHRG